MNKECKYCKKEFRVRPYRVGSAKFCSYSCAARHKNNIQWADTRFRKNMLAVLKSNKGEKHWNWQGGVTPERTKIWKSEKYRKWRKEVFIRDDHTCQQCGVKGGTLNADHIKPFALFKDLRFNIDNGRTLCIGCHRKTNTYGVNRIYLEAMQWL